MNDMFEWSNSLNIPSILKRQFFLTKILNINVSDKQTNNLIKRIERILAH